MHMDPLALVGLLKKNGAKSKKLNIVTQARTTESTVTEKIRTSSMKDTHGTQPIVRANTRPVEKSVQQSRKKMASKTLPSPTASEIESLAKPARVDGKPKVVYAASETSDEEEGETKLQYLQRKRIEYYNQRPKTKGNDSDSDLDLRHKAPPKYAPKAKRPIVEPHPSKGHTILFRKEQTKDRNSSHKDVSETIILYSSGDEIASTVKGHPPHKVKRTATPVEDEECKQDTNSKRKPLGPSQVSYWKQKSSELGDFANSIKQAFWRICCEFTWFPDEFEKQEFVKEAYKNAVKLFEKEAGAGAKRMSCHHMKETN
jgi:hypothetical protein